MRRFLISVVALSFQMAAIGQNTWSSNIAQLVYDNCSSCHNPNGIGSFNLLTYEDAKAASAGIRTAVSLKTMPPWIADSDYQRYTHERVLTDSEIKMITEWVDAGSPEGDASKTPPPPVYETKGYITEKPDLELRMPTYASKATGKSDDYVCFSLPSGLTKNKKIRAFELIPGNHNIVHHSLVYLDDAGTYPTDTTRGVCTGPTNGLIGGYVPGSPPTIFPGNGTDFNLGFEIKAGSNVVLAMHYPEGSFGMVDSSIIRFWFYDDDVTIRELETKPLIENWQFVLPPNQVTPVKDDRKMNGTDYSMLSVFPHMHLLGNTIQSYAITPSGDTLPFVNITHWDFEWQEFLFFNRIIKLPKGSTIYGNGTYDNSSNNHHNPNNPPILVRPGLNTSDEMFLIYFHYLPYVAGDENRDIEQLRSLSSKKIGFENNIISVYPNPAHDAISFNLADQPANSVLMRIYDSHGQLVESINDSNTIRVDWSIPSDLKSGVYYYSVNLGGRMFSGRFMVR